MKTYIPLNGLSGVAIAVLPSIICIQLTFSDGLGGRAKHPNPIFLHLFYPLKPDFHRFKKSQQVNESTGQRVIGYRGKIGDNGF